MFGMLIKWLIIRGRVSLLLFEIKVIEFKLQEKCTKIRKKLNVLKRTRGVTLLVAKRPLCIELLKVNQESFKVFLMKKSVSEFDLIENKDNNPERIFTKSIVNDEL